MTEEIKKLGVDEKSDLYICLYWPPRSGGTFIWQVLTNIFSKVASTHDATYLETDSSIVIVYRDFRDTTVSHWRTQYGEYDSEGKLINHPDRTQLMKMINGTKGSTYRLSLYRNKFWKNEKALWLKYEDFFGNYDYLFKTIEEFFKIELSKEKKEKIIGETCVKNNIERQKIVKRSDTPPNAIIRTDFDIFNPYNKLHRHHIHTGVVGTWKELLSKELGILLNKKLGLELRQWNYKVEEE